MREKEPSTQIIFCRHGQTDFPLDRIYCDGREDPSLNSNGRQQALLSQDMLRDSNISAIYTSPAARTSETAEIINQPHGLKILSDGALKERFFGIWEGLYFHEIERDYPADYIKWKQNPARFQPQGGESMLSLQQRLGDALQSIISNHLQQTILVVTHVGPIRVIVSDALQMPIEMHRHLRIDYAALTRIDFGVKKLNLIYLNHHCILPRV